MKQLLLGIILMVASSVTFAATEIWMMHNPACKYCTAFLDDHNIEVATTPELAAYDALHPKHIVDNIPLVILDLTGGRQNAPTQILKAIDGRKLPHFSGTPHFYRWDTETESVTSEWTGWHSSMSDDFRNWVLTGDKPTR